MKGFVLRSVGSWYDIMGEDGIKYKGRLKGKFKMDDKQVTNPIAVGDFVLFTKEEIENQVVIQEIEPRENYIIRKSSHKNHHAHIIASNIDLALLVVTLVFPRTSIGFIDRFLVAAESFRIPVVLVFNKSDLYDPQLLEDYHQLKMLYISLGYGVILISVEQDTNIDLLYQIIEGKKSLISGHSGVGKTSLMNKIIPGLDLKTSSISNFANKGVHTTTFAEMFEINDSTYLIDTPGIKEFGLWDMDDNEISHYYPEMRELIGNCKFHNCKHINEPGCAVIQQVEAGQIALSRYKSYLSIIENEDNRK